MKKNILLKIIVLLIIAMFVAISCKNSSNNAVETFNLENSVTPANAGTVSPAGGSFEAGEEVQITAIPNENWLFKEWNGDFSGSDNPASVTITKNMSINALFEQLTYPLTIEVEGEGDVSEQIVNAKTDYAPGAMVELTGTPANEWRFVEWTGDLVSAENPATVSMDGPKIINAIFEFGFNEDFEEETAENWLFSDDRFLIMDGNLRFSSGEDENWGSAYYDQVFSDFRIETRMTRTKSDETVDFSQSLFLRSTGFMSYETPVSGYEFNITQNGFGSVWKIENGVESNLIPWVEVEQLNTELGDYNTIAVNANGEKFDIYINGEHIIGFSDNSFSEGFAGVTLYASGEGSNEALWDYVNLLPADSAAKTSQHQWKVNQPRAVEDGGSSSHHNFN